MKNHHHIVSAIQLSLSLNQRENIIAHYTPSHSSDSALLFYLSANNNKPP